MSSAPPAPFSTRPRRRSRAARAVLAAASVLALTLAAGCGGSSSGTAPAPTAGSAAPASSVAPLTLDIVIAQGNVTPNGQKLDVAVGQPVVLRVTSDTDDEIHAHTGGDGYELAVTAGQPATGTFTLPSAGSFEVESHRLEKVIVVLNAR